MVYMDVFLKVMGVVLLLPYFVLIWKKNYTPRKKKDGEPKDPLDYLVTGLTIIGILLISFS